MSRHSQRGFSAVEIIIGVFVVAAIAVTGYLAYNRMQDSAKTPTAAQQATQASAPTAPTVNDTKDLDDASKTLDNTNVDASATDSSELDTELSSF